MQIKEMERFSSGYNGLRTSNATSDFSTSKADIDFFTSTLEHSASPTRATASPSGSNILLEASNQLVKSTDRA